MTCGIYEIKNLESNQSYIGRSLNIENRWNGHKSAPTNNMIPTIELYESNPNLVEFNIIRKVDDTVFDKQELKFITSVCELYEINQRGGWDSDNLINGRDGNILACPPSILSKRELLPSCIDVEDIFYGLEQWFNDDYSFKSKYDTYSMEYWLNKYHDCYDEYEALKEEYKLLKKSVKNNTNIYKQKMEADYEYFKLTEENAVMQDLVDELNSKVSFWKSKCLSWREKFFSLQKRINKVKL